MIVFIVIQTLRILTIVAVAAGGLIAYVGFHEGTELQSIAYVLAGLACDSTHTSSPIVSCALSSRCWKQRGTR